MPASCEQFPRLFSAILFMAGIVADSAVAQSYSANYSALPVNVSLVRQESLRRVTAPRVLVAAGTNKFYFPLLDGYRMRSDTAQGKVLLVKTNEAWILTLRVLKPLGQGVIVDSTPYQQFLSSQYPGAIIREEISATAANHLGSAFDLQWKVYAGTTATARVAFIPSDAEILEFSVLTTSDHFPPALTDFNKLLMSFRVATDGKIIIRPSPETS